MKFAKFCKIPHLCINPLEILISLPNLKEENKEIIKLIRNVLHVFKDNGNDFVSIAIIFLTTPQTDPIDLGFVSWLFCRSSAIIYWGHRPRSKIQSPKSN